jgi:ABC-type branched-subunit amino acid transport system permease subunit
VIKYFENIFSSFNEGILMKAFDFLPEGLQHVVVSVSSLFVGEGWHLTLGALFMLIVIFLPGGLMEGFSRLRTALENKFGGGGDGDPEPVAVVPPVPAARGV